MSTVFLICGVVGSGKTYYAKELCNEYNAELVSCDEVMIFNYNNISISFEDFLLKTKIFLYEKAVGILKDNKNVVLDWGFWTKSERIFATEYFRNFHFDLKWVYIDVSKDRLIKNINLRNQKSNDSFVIDSNLINKCNMVFEKPDKLEVDVWYIND